MSDITDDNPLFSQDDIDKLLNASSIEDAEEDISTVEDDGIGELSQDDIDRLLNAASSGDEPQTSSVGEENADTTINDDLINNDLATDKLIDDLGDDGLSDDDLGDLSQDDIDKLLNADTEIGEESGSGDFPANDMAPPDEDSDLGDLSQDDIDRLLNASSVTDGSETAPVEDADDDDDDLGDLSQDDIDRMLNDSSSDSDASAVKPAGDSDSGADAFDLISQDDIDKLMSTDISDDDLMGGAGLDDLDSDTAGVDSFSADEEEIIDPSEGFNIEDCMITQDTLDSLMSSAVQSDEVPDSVIQQRAPEPESDDPFQVTLSVDDTEPDFDMDGDISSADLDSLLGDSPEDMDDLLNDISQEDIDGFLNEESSDPDDLVANRNESDDSVKNVISQEDIDALLSGSDEEDEDILADMEMDEDLKVSSAPAGKVETPLAEDDESQVILEDPEETQTTLADGTARQLTDLMEGDNPKKKGRRGFIFKLVLILTLVVILIAGCVAGAYFMFFKDKVDKLVPFPETAVQSTQSMDMSTPQPDMENINTKELSPGAMTLESFMVLTPNRKDGIAYISVDVTLNYSYSSVADEINRKLPYFRGVIYSSIADALKSDKGDRLTESDLLEIVKKAIDSSLPEMKVDKVTFINFKTG